MDTYKVKPLEEPMEVCVQVPGSKSMTNRALLLAAMGEGMTLLHGVQFRFLAFSYSLTGFRV